MFEVQDILDFFLSPELVDTMGNWYPRVVAVMSCVIPTMYLAFCMVCVVMILACIWRLTAK